MEETLHRSQSTLKRRRVTAAPAPEGAEAPAPAPDGDGGGAGLHGDDSAETAKHRIDGLAKRMGDVAAHLSSVSGPLSLDVCEQLVRQLELQAASLAVPPVMAVTGGITSPASSSASAEWVCPVCDTRNPGSKQDCSFCSASKQEAADEPFSSLSSPDIAGAPQQPWPLAKLKPLRDDADVGQPPARLQATARTALAQLESRKVTAVNAQEGLRVIHAGGRAGCLLGAVQPRPMKSALVSWDDGAAPSEVPMKNLKKEASCRLERLSPGPLQGTASDLKIGLCLAIKNRAWQLKQTLPLNILNCWRHQKWVKIYLVDFGSDDGCLDYIKSNFQYAIEAKLLRVFSGDLQFWHCSIAKNTAHRLAMEECDVVCNLDADNVLSPDFVTDVRNRMLGGAGLIQYYNGDILKHDGTYGRIACRSIDFQYLRGYDEAALPAGAHDGDLMLRLRLLGRRKERVTSQALSCAIPNTKEETLRFTSPEHEALPWSVMERRNAEHFRLLRAKGVLVRNLLSSGGGSSHKADKPCILPSIGAPAWELGFWRVCVHFTSAGSKTSVSWGRLPEKARLWTMYIRGLQDLLHVVQNGTAHQDELECLTKLASLLAELGMNSAPALAPAAALAVEMLSCLMLTNQLPRTVCEALLENIRWLLPLQPKLLLGRKVLEVLNQLLEPSSDLKLSALRLLAGQLADSGSPNLVTESQQALILERADQLLCCAEVALQVLKTSVKDLLAPQDPPLQPGSIPQLVFESLRVLRGLLGWKILPTRLCQLILPSCIQACFALEPAIRNAAGHLAQQLTPWLLAQPGGEERILEGGLTGSFVLLFAAKAGTRASGDVAFGRWDAWQSMADQGLDCVIASDRDQCDARILRAAAQRLLGLLEQSGSPDLDHELGVRAGRLGLAELHRLFGNFLSRSMRALIHSGGQALKEEMLHNCAIRVQALRDDEARSQAAVAALEGLLMELSEEGPPPNVPVRLFFQGGDLGLGASCRRAAQAKLKAIQPPASSRRKRAAITCGESAKPSASSSCGELNEARSAGADPPLPQPSASSSCGELKKASSAGADSQLPQPSASTVARFAEALQVSGAPIHQGWLNGKYNLVQRSQLPPHTRALLGDSQGDCLYVGNYLEGSATHIWKDQRHNQWKISTLARSGSHYLTSGEVSAGNWKPGPKEGRLKEFTDSPQWARQIKVEDLANNPQEAADDMDSCSHAPSMVETGAEPESEPLDEPEAEVRSAEMISEPRLRFLTERISRAFTAEQTDSLPQQELMCKINAGLPSHTSFDETEFRTGLAKLDSLNKVVLQDVTVYRT